MTDRLISLNAAIEDLRAMICEGDTDKHVSWNGALNKAIERLSALPDAWQGIEVSAAKSGDYVLAKVKHHPAESQWSHLSGRWFVVRYISEGDWALYPGFGVGDDWFECFAPLPEPPK